MCAGRVPPPTVDNFVRDIERRDAQRTPGERIVVGRERESAVAEDAGNRKVDRPMELAIAQIDQSYRYIAAGLGPQGSGTGKNSMALRLVIASLGAGDRYSTSVVSH